VIIFKLEVRRPHLHFISSGVVLIAIAFVLLNVPGVNFEWLAIITILFFTVGEIVSMPFMNSYWISRSLNHNRGQYAALYTVAWASAQATGPYTGALVAEKYGYQTLWWLITGICIVLAFLCRWLHFKTELITLSRMETG